MRDYKVKSNVKVEFYTTMLQKGTDVFDVEAKMEKIIRMSLETFLKDLKDDESKLFVEINSFSEDLNGVNKNECNWIKG